MLIRPLGFKFWWSANCIAVFNRISCNFVSHFFSGTQIESKSDYILLKKAGEEWQQPKLALLSVVALLVAAEATAEAKTCHCGPTRTRLQCLNFFWAVTAPAILPQLLCFNRIFETNVARFACKYFLSCWDTLYRGAIEARMLNYSTNLLCVLKKTQAGIYQKEANNIWASSFTFFAASFAV